MKDLFGIEVPEKTRKETRHRGYGAFVDKFRPKLTTDECHTPEEVYTAVLQWARQNLPVVEGAQVLRPFRTDGDYEAETYPEGCCVVDNPPFSIYRRVVRFYADRRVSFLLFAPHLTALVPQARGVTLIITDSEITYANGAVVRTAFITNMLPDVSVWVCPELGETIRRTQRGDPDAQRKLPRLELPDRVATVSRLSPLARYGVELTLRSADTLCVDAVGSARKRLFGGGLLLSRRASDALAEAERRALEERRKMDNKPVKLTLTPAELTKADKLG